MKKFIKSVDCNLKSLTNVEVILDNYFSFNEKHINCFDFEDKVIYVFYISETYAIQTINKKSEEVKEKIDFTYLTKPQLIDFLFKNRKGFKFLSII